MAKRASICFTLPMASTSSLGTEINAGLLGRASSGRTNAGSGVFLQFDCVVLPLPHLWSAAPRICIETVIASRHQQERCCSIPDEAAPSATLSASRSLRRCTVAALFRVLGFQDVLALVEKQGKASVKRTQISRLVCGWYQARQEEHFHIPLWS